MSAKIYQRILRSFFLLSALIAGASAARAAQQCRLYVSDYNTSSVRVMNCTTGAAMSPVQVGVQPFGIVASADGNWVTVANYGSNNIKVINTDSNVVTYEAGVETGPIGVAISPDGSRLAVANYEADSVSILDTHGFTTSPSLITSVRLPAGSRPDNVAFSSDSTVVFVARWGDSKVSAIDITAANFPVLQTVSVGNQPSAFAVSPDGSKLYVSNEFGGTAGAYEGSVSALNYDKTAKQLSVAAEWLLPYHSFPMQQMALSANGRTLYVLGEGNASAFVIDADDGSLKATVRIGVQPMGAAFSLDGSKLFVAHGNAIATMETGWNTVPGADITLGTQSSWLLNMVVVSKCS